MAKLNMKRIELLMMLEDSKEIIDCIQRSGVIEISESEENEKLFKLPMSSTVSQLEKYINTAEAAKGILNKYVPKKSSLLSSLSPRKEITVSEFLKQSEKADSILSDCFVIASCERRINEAKVGITRLQAQIDALDSWKNLDIPMKMTETKDTSVFIGSFPMLYDSNSLIDAIMSFDKQIEAVSAEIVSQSKDKTCAVIICYKSYSEQVEAALKALNFVKPSDPTKHKPAIRIKRCADGIKAYETTVTEYIEKIKVLSDKRDDIDFIIDYLTMRRDKYEALSKLSMSTDIMVVNGYIPEKYVKQLTDKLESKFDTAISITDVDDDDENVPVELENDGFVSPVESITAMYSLPGRHDIDPNPIMAFFYYVFFGLMLSDAGYGVVMVLSMLIVKKKFKLEDKMKKTVNMFLYCGISTVFWGTMFGSWFGDIVGTICTNFLNKPAPRLYIWLDPVNDPMKLLLFCFLFGIIHLFVGLGVRFSQLWKSDKKMDAVCDVVFVYLLVAGIAPFGASILTSIPQTIIKIGEYLAIIGALGIVLTSGRSSKNIFGKLGGGLYGLYNTASGYLGDILSYSRLLALGLSTGVIASVVNMLGALPENKIVKAIMLTIVFIFGHIVNMAINLIGTYVHTNRLQYVEFFSKFYEGGGRSFTPLVSNTKSFRFKEEK